MESYLSLKDRGPQSVSGQGEGDTLLLAVSPFPNSTKGKNSQDNRDQPFYKIRFHDAHLPPNLFMHSILPAQLICQGKKRLGQKS